MLDFDGIKGFSQLVYQQSLDFYRFAKFIGSLECHQAVQPRNQFSTLWENIYNGVVFCFSWLCDGFIVVDDDVSLKTKSRVIIQAPTRVYLHADDAARIISGQLETSLGCGLEKRGNVLANKLASLIKPLHVNMFAKLRKSLIIKDINLVPNGFLFVVNRFVKMYMYFLFWKLLCKYIDHGINPLPMGCFDD